MGLVSLLSAPKGPVPSRYLGESLVAGQPGADCQGTAGRAGMPARAANPPGSLARGERPGGGQPLRAHEDVTGAASKDAAGCCPHHSCCPQLTVLGTGP